MGKKLDCTHIQYNITTDKIDRIEFDSLYVHPSDIDQFKMDLEHVRLKYLEKRDYRIMKEATRKKG